MYLGFDLDIPAHGAPERFARELACTVNGSAVHLASVRVAERQVYPVADGEVPADAVRTCRFRVRRHGAVIDGADVAALLSRIGARFTWTALRPVLAPGERGVAA